MSSPPAIYGLARAFARITEDSVKGNFVKRVRPPTAAMRSGTTMQPRSCEASYAGWLRPGRAHAAWLCVVILVLGCGDGSGGSASGPLDPQSCQAVGQLPPDCSQAEIDTYSSCYNDACEVTFSGCYGPGYLQGEYSGPCADYVECATGCDCEDTACSQDCPEAQTCAACLNARPCGLDCPLPACTSRPGQHTCAELEVCCAGISDAERRASCLDAVQMGEMLGANGDLVCNIGYPIYAAMSDAPGCR